MNKLIVVSLILSRLVVAETDPHYEAKGYVLTQDSWVFSPEKAKDVRNRLIDLDVTVKINESLNRSLDLYKANEQINQNKINLLIEQNDKLAKNLNDSRTLNNWERFGLFALGIGATVFAGWAIGQAGK